MRFARVREPGRERPAVQGGDGALRLLPETLGDIDGQFWIDGRRDEVEELLTLNGHAEFAGTSEHFGAPIAKPERSSASHSTTATTLWRLAVLFSRSPSFA